MSFLDPQLTTDGKPWGPHRYKEIVKERWYISKHTNTSYSDTGDITPLEREYLIEFINEDLKATKDIIEKSNRKGKHSSKEMRVPQFPTPHKE